MTTIQPLERPRTGARRATPFPEASMTRILIADLKRFWPSRRGHAFDELCR